MLTKICATLKECKQFPAGKLDTLLTALKKLGAVSQSPTTANAKTSVGDTVVLILSRWEDINSLSSQGDLKLAAWPKNLAAEPLVQACMKAVDHESGFRAGLADMVGEEVSGLVLAFSESSLDCLQDAVNRLLGPLIGKAMMLSFYTRCISVYQGSTQSISISSVVEWGGAGETL